MKSSKNTSVIRESKQDTKNQLQVKVIKLFQQERTIPEIANILGVSQSRIIRCVPEELVTKRIEELLQQGLGFYHIGDIMGIAGKTVVARAKKAGIVSLYTIKIIQMFQDRIPINSIAEELNMNTQKVIAAIPTSVRSTRLKELYIDQELPYNEIIKKLGISRSSLKNWLRKYELMNRHPNAGREMKKYPKQKIILDYVQLNSLETIAEKRNFPRTTVRRILNEAGLKRYSSLAMIRNHVNGVYNITINEYLKEVISGELLGDGNISFSRSKSIRPISKEEYLQAVNVLRGFKTTIPDDIKFDASSFNEATGILCDYRVARMNFVTSLLSIPWTLHIKDIFRNNGIQMSHKINDASVLAANHNTVSLWSRGTLQLREIYENWYQNGEKNIPRNILMSPTLLLHWFIGDGSFSDSTIQISTHCFSITDVKFMIDLLNRSLNICSRYRIEDQTFPVLKIYRNVDVKFFLEYLESARPSSLSLAKEVFPWKFDGSLRKRDVMMSEWYPEVIHRLLGKESETAYSLIRDTIKQYYFKN
ncbi:MAG: hypothetical protein ACW964_09710 [Candidatus Hodarchaeales archaeon]